FKWTLCNAENHFSHLWSLAQFVLTQPPSASESPEQTVTISCARSRSSISSYYVSWYQQKPGNVPRRLIQGTSARPAGVPERFTASMSGNTMSLTIAGALAEDDAGYYCSLGCSDSLSAPNPNSLS
uniref:Ig-like domain-containing protein n=1 Tax=Gopherus evgoodei TaxID=1825980 RepID=A0A8C4WTI4_9SAUR